MNYIIVFLINPNCLTMSLSIHRLGKLTSRFGITHVPTLVKQNGMNLKGAFQFYR